MSPETRTKTEAQTGAVPPATATSPEAAAAPTPPPISVVPDLLRQRAALQPDAVALSVDGAEELRYRDWDERSDAVARSLAAQGAGRGRRIGLLFGGMEWIDYAVGYFGVLKSGATAVHLNADQPAEELDRRLAAVPVDGLVHAPGRATPAGFSGWTADTEVLGAADSTLSGAPPAIEPEDVADIFFTSGTTGPAKAYQVPHGNAVFGRKIGSLGAFGDSAYMLTMLQIATGSSASALNIATVAQVVTVLCPMRDVERMGELIERFRAGTAAITPWVAGRMVVGRLDERHDLSSITMFACGSAPLPPARARALLRMVPGARITSACSQSEASPALVVNSFDPERPMTVGKQMPGTELRIVDEDGTDLPVGEVGEIWLRHLAPKRLYVDLPEVNARVLADGWHRTGDLGRLDADGWLELFDRRADVVRTDQGLVSTLAVEAALYEHPAVVEAAAFAISAADAAGTQQVAAAVVLAPADADVLAAVEAHLKELLAPHEAPVKLVLLDELPRNSQNKVLKRQLRELYG